MRTISSLSLQIQIRQAALRNQKHRYWFLMSDLLSVMTRCNKNQPASTFPQMYFQFKLSLFWIVFYVTSAGRCNYGWWMLPKADGLLRYSVRALKTSKSMEFRRQLRTKMCKSTPRVIGSLWMSGLSWKALMSFVFKTNQALVMKTYVQHFRLFLGLPSSTYRCSWTSTSGRGGSRKCKGSRSRRRSNKRRGRRRRQRRPPWPGPASS